MVSSRDFIFLTDHLSKIKAGYVLFLMETRCSDTASYYRGWEGTVSLEDKVVITIDEPFQQISSGTTCGTGTTNKSCSKYVWI